MTTLAGGRWNSRSAGIALLAVVVLASGCGRPPDEAWLRFLGFRSGDNTALTVLKGTLRDDTAMTANADFENRSQYIGQSGIGTGILVNHVRIDYSMVKYYPPSAEYDVNLYLRPPVKDATTLPLNTLSLSLVSASLKHWLVETKAFETKNGAESFVEITARVTFQGLTDEGGKLETVGSIGIELYNSGVTR